MQSLCLRIPPPPLPLGSLTHPHDHAPLTRKGVAFPPPSPLSAWSSLLPFFTQRLGLRPSSSETNRIVEFPPFPPFPPPPPSAAQISAGVTGLSFPFPRSAVVPGIALRPARLFPLGLPFALYLFFFELAKLSFFRGTRKAWTPPDPLHDLSILKKSYLEF